MSISELTKEYLEKYAGDEYVYEYVYREGKYCTVVYELLEKSVCVDDKFSYIYDKNRYRYTNCKIVDIVDNECFAREKEIKIFQYLINDDTTSVRRTKYIDDIIESDTFVPVYKSLEKYLHDHTLRGAMKRLI